MEEILDKSGKAVRDLQEALNRYIALEEEIRELELYYAGGQWQKDFADDEAGKFPRNIRRGVLSEDAVYLKKRYANWNCIMQAGNGKKILPTMRQANFPGI